MNSDDERTVQDTVSAIPMGDGRTPLTLTPGMAVVGSDAHAVGTVKETRGSLFLIDRPLRRDVWAPLSAAQSVSTEQVTLGCSADEVDEQGWESPPMMGGDTDDSAARPTL
jgi:hypothetical protein